MKEYAPQKKIKKRQKREFLPLSSVSGRRCLQTGIEEKRQISFTIIYR